MSANPLDPAKQSADIGIVITRGGVIVNDQPFNIPNATNGQGEYSAMISTGTGGDIMCIGESTPSAPENIIPLFNMPPGALVPVKAKMIKSTVTIGEDIYTTTAEDMVWLGGQ